MEPPEWRFPVRRELGSLLSKIGRAQEATMIFWEDLRRHPENGWALNGIVQRHLPNQGYGRNAPGCRQI